MKKIENERQGMMEIESEMLRKKRYRDRERRDKQKETKKRETEKDAQRTEMQGEIDTEERWRLNMGGGEKDREKETLRERRKRQADA